VASAASRLRPDSPASWGGSVFDRRQWVNFQPAMTRILEHVRRDPFRRALQSIAPTPREIPQLARLAVVRRPPIGVDTWERLC